MSKKSHVNIHQPRPAHSAAPFPAACHVLTGRQRDLPNPTAALANLGQPSERARREAQQILAAAERPAPTVHDDLQAAKRRPWDAPMATKANQLPQPPAPMICGVSGLPDPLATLAWEAVVTDAAATARSLWTRVRLPLAFTAWSIGCFSLGVLSRG